MKNIVIIALLFSFAAFGRTGKMEAGNNLPAIEGHSDLENKITYVLVDKEQIALRKLPTFAQKYIKENFPVRQVSKIYKVKESKNVLYEVEISLEGKTSVVKFDKNGELVDEVVKK